tara:strand:+ start:1378 stop:1869 length:492 start_codon:yes stop_codon:yes gene_type:complete
MLPVVRSSLLGLLFVIFIVVLFSLCSGCTTTAPTGIPWVKPIPDYSAPQTPTVAPDAPGSCREAKPLSEGDVAACTGLLMVPSEVQLLYDTEDQAQPLRDLLHLSVEGRERDRAWADAHYLRILEERDRARRQRWEAFAVGSAIGFGVCGGLISGIVLQLNAN